ncbi:MAG: ABC transporter ATP-binding protein, partial [Oscillospiraceae bacterium]
MNNVSILKCEDISFGYGKNLVLDKISADIPKKSLVSIVGTNGSGKTTLFNLLCGYKKPKVGNIYFENTNLDSIHIKDRAKIFSVIHQGNTINFPFTCIEIVMLGLNPYLSRFEKISEEDYAAAKKAMLLTDTYKFSQKLFSEISGGERQRVSLARAIVGKPKVIFLDEAMSELDIASKIHMIKLIKDFAKESGSTVVEVSHDISLSYKWSDHIISMKDG